MRLLYPGCGQANELCSMLNLCLQSFALVTERERLDARAKSYYSRCLHYDVDCKHDRV